MNPKLVVWLAFVVLIYITTIYSPVKDRALGFFLGWVASGVCLMLFGLMLGENEKK